MTTIQESPALRELIPAPCWVVYIDNKCPYNPVTGKPAEADDPTTWVTYDEARIAVMKNSGRFKGIGREVTAEDRLVVIDLDKCIDEDGTISGFAQDIVARVNSYTEISPSGHGLHIWTHGTIPANVPSNKPKPDGIEMYYRGHYLTWTGNHLGGTPLVIEDRSTIAQAIYQEVMTRRESLKASTRTQKQFQPLTPTSTSNGHARYAETALRDECAILASAQNGCRNDQLNESAFNMGTLVGAGVLDRALAESELYNAAVETGLPLAEIEKHIKHGIDDGIHHPRDIKDDWVEYRPGNAREMNGNGNRNRNRNRQEDDGEDEDENKGQGSQASVLRRLALEHAKLFSTPNGERYARIERNGHIETLAINEKNGPFKRWLTYQYGQATGNIPNATALSAAIASLEAEAQFGNHPTLDVFLRVAEYNGKVYLDLAQGEVVEIDADGWRIIPQSPVCFKQPVGMLPLPRPVHGGSIAELRRFINAETNEDWVLILAWLIGCFHPNGPYPILNIHGERGSAKSTTTRLLRTLIDPSQAPLRKEPEDSRTLAIMAHNNRVLAFDNLSHMPEWLSDALCRLATGAGDGYRSLYTNDEECIFNAKRPIILNGIEEVATRGDLLDRAITVNLPAIAQRKDEKTFWREVDEAHPRILGALLDIVSLALRNQSNVSSKDLPRMADFALWILACESKIARPGVFMTAYAHNRETAINVELEASPVATALMTLMDTCEKWEGSATDLLSALRRVVGEEVSKSKVWPKNSRSIGGKLKRLATSLRSVGIHISQDRNHDGRIIVIEKRDANDEIRDAKSPIRDANEGSVTQNFSVCVTPSDHSTPSFDPLRDVRDANNTHFFSLGIQEKREKETEEREDGGVEKDEEILRHERHDSSPDFDTIEVSIEEDGVENHPQLPALPAIENPSSPHFQLHRWQWVDTPKGRGRVISLGLDRITVDVMGTRYDYRGASMRLITPVVNN
jgi:hypothetical protein